MIRLPARLKELLEQDRELQTAVNASLDEFEPWLEAGGKRPAFFPDYTDHSVQHVNEVLETAVSLVRDEAWEAFSPGDAAVLVLATLLHDSAMHLTREGFEALMHPETRWTPIADFNDKPWLQLWTDFTMEARRFDQRQLVDLFGDAEPVHVPDLEILRLDDRARRLIGEFVRRHHPRLAHEIARHGVPGPSGEPLRLHADPEIADLAGLIARSHGLSARACLPYLRKHFGSRTDPLGVHAVFLIVLLRLADYLQIQAGRAPERTLKVHKIRSPYSAVEWKMHASVKDVREHEEDSEAVYVRAKPQDVQTYLRMKQWLLGFQDEIDASWAVLGEVYSRQGKSMDNLGVKVRRILSNLDHEPEFATTVNYIPRHIAFTAAGADLLKLLIGPLYGERPEIGVRELIQNAVDAVRELEILRRRGGIVPADLDLPEQDADVLVTLDQADDGSFWLSVSDRGVGMTADVLQDYFLKAGASFRDSSAWHKHFLDEAGESTVLRSGRFGIGALAAFLLGSELRVATRHFSAPPGEGMSFVATMDTTSIQVNRVEREVGTTVSVRLTADHAALLGEAMRVSQQMSLGFSGRFRIDRWNWYFLLWPKVQRRIGYEPLPRGVALPEEDSVLPPEWYRLQVAGYSDVQWTYRPAPLLTCNGIRVKHRESGVELLRDTGIPLSTPNVSVFDRNGVLPLNLTRDDLTTDRLPFEDALAHDVIKDYIAWSLLTAPTEGLDTGADPLWYLGHGYRGMAIDTSLHDHTSGNPVSYGGHWGTISDQIIPLQAQNLWGVDAQRFLFMPVLYSITPTPEWFAGKNRHFIGYTPPFTGLYDGGYLPFPLQATERESYLKAVLLRETKDKLEAQKDWQYVHEAIARRVTQLMTQFNVLSTTKNLGLPPSLWYSRELRKAYHINGITMYFPKLWKGLANGVLKQIPNLRKQDFGEFSVLSIQTRHTGREHAPPFQAGELPLVPLVECLVERREAPPAEHSALSQAWTELLHSPSMSMHTEERHQMIQNCGALRSYVDSHIRAGASVGERQPSVERIALAIREWGTLLRP